MAVTGRLGLLALLGAIVPLLVQSWWALLAVEAVLLAGVLIDLALAGNLRALRYHRTGDTNVRLGESARVSLIVENLGGRPVNGRLRDAWPPSAVATPRAVPVRIPPGERQRIDMTLVPTRRGDRDRKSVV